MCESCEEAAKLFERLEPNYERQLGVAFYAPKPGELQIVMLDDEYSAYLIERHGAAEIAAALKDEIDAGVGALLVEVVEQSFSGANVIVAPDGEERPMLRWDVDVQVHAPALSEQAFPAPAELLALPEVPLDADALMNGILRCECGLPMYAFAGFYLCPGFDLARRT